MDRQPSWPDLLFGSSIEPAFQFGWCLLENVTDQELQEPELCITSRCSVICAWHIQHVKVFSRLNKPIGKLERSGGIDVAVQFADYEKQSTLQFGGIVDGGGLRIFHQILSSRLS